MRPASPAGCNGHPVDGGCVTSVNCWLMPAWRPTARKGVSLCLGAVALRWETRSERVKQTAAEGG